MTSELARGWFLQVEPVPDWLLARLVQGGDDIAPDPPLADKVYSVAEQQGVFRVLLEFDPRVALHSFLVGQLVALQKRVWLRGGLLRLCGVSPANYEVIRLMRLSDRLPNYADRQAALGGHAPA